MKTVLLIEDTAEIRENLSELLELHSYKVFTADNGLRGWEIVQEHLPSAIICDVKMPKMSGFELLQLLRTRADTACIPFIFISASAQKHEVMKGENAGAFAYVTKPFKIEEILELLEKVC